MKIHEYNEMMAYLTRPARVGLAGGTNPKTGMGFQKGNPYGTALKGKPSLNVTGINQYPQLTKAEMQAIIDANPGLKSPKDFEKAKLLGRRAMENNPDLVFQRRGYPDPDPAKTTATDIKRKEAKIRLEGRAVQLKPPKGYQVHHIMPLAGNVDINTGDLAVISKQMNAKLSKYDKLINDLTNEAAGLDFSTKGSTTRLDEINKELSGILKKVEKDLPKKYKGLLGFNKLTPITDEYGTVIRLSEEPVGIDYTKSIAGEKGTKIRDTKKSNIQKLVAKAPKFKASMVPGLEDLVKAVESIPNDFKAKRYWTVGLKSLGIAATPLIAYDGYTAIKQGLPPDEVVARALLGADKLLYKGKEILQLTPEEREARKVVKQEKLKELNEDQMMGFGFIEGPEVDSDLSVEEAEAKWKEGQDRWADFREKKDAARASERAGIAKEIKDRIYGVPLKEITDQLYNQGGRVGYAKGPKSPGRRTFIKGISAAAMLPFIGKYFKAGKLLTKAGAYTGPVIQKVQGMPEWLPSLVKRLWNEGEDVTKTASTMERQVVKRGTLESGDDVDLIYDVGTGNVSVNVTPKKQLGNTGSGAHNKEYGLELKKGEEIATKKGSIKTKDEFSVHESQPIRTGHPEDPDWDWDWTQTTVDDAITDLTELEAFATKKTTKQLHKKKGTTKKDVNPEIDYSEYDYGDYDID